MDETRWCKVYNGTMERGTLVGVNGSPVDVEGVVSMDICRVSLRKNLKGGQK